MHVLHIYKTFYGNGFGGIEQVIRQLASELRGEGVKLSLVTLGGKGGEPEVFEQDGITIHRFPTDVEVASNGFSLSAIRHYRAIAATADVLHYQFPWPSGDLLHQFAPKHVPALVSYQSDIVRQKLLKIAYAPLMEVFLRQMDAIVASTPNYIASSPVLPRFKDKLHCIPIGISEELYPVPSASSLADWQKRLPKDFFLFVGVLRYYKGLHTLVEAARKTGLPVVIAGSGPQEEELKQQAAGLENVHFIGRVSDEDKMALLRLCRAFVFPSHLRSEAFGISLLEAAMTGKPMISCEIGSGMSYINQAGETGLIVPPESPDDFAAAMATLAQDDARCAQMGKAARARYETVFTAKTMAQSYLALYRKLVAGGKKA